MGMSDMTDGDIKEAGREDFKVNLAVSALTAVARLPLGVLYLFSDIAYVVTYYLVRYRRRMVRHNLSLVYGNDDTKKLRRIERRFYRHLCDVIVETVKLLRFSDEEADRRIEVAGAGQVDEARRQGRSSVLFLGHYGNWEWVTAIVRHFHTDLRFCQLYSPLRNKVVDRIMLKIRSRFGSESLPKKQALRHLLAMERDGNHFVTGFISDQRPLGRNLHNWTRFMGLPTDYMVGGESIGDHIGAAFFYLDITKPKRGHYTIRFVPLNRIDDSPNAVTRDFMRHLERSIYREPHLWLWSHNRWKHIRKAPDTLDGEEGD